MFLNDHLEDDSNFFLTILYPNICFRGQLKENAKELKKEFGAKQVAVDGCNDISLKTEWIWVSVGLGINQKIINISYG